MHIKEFVYNIYIFANNEICIYIYNIYIYIYIYNIYRGYRHIKAHNSTFVSNVVLQKKTFKKKKLKYINKHK